MQTKEDKAIYDRKRRELKREELKEKQKIYSEKNRELLRQKAKEHYYKNKEILSEKKKKYYQDNKELILEKCKEYRLTKPKKEYVDKGTGNYNITLAERHKEEWLNEKIFLYKLQIVDDNQKIFYKTGLSKNIRNRLYYIPYSVIILESIEMNKYDAVYKEREILNNVEKYTPLKKFGGYTECYL